MNGYDNVDDKTRKMINDLYSESKTLTKINNIGADPCVDLTKAQNEVATLREMWEKAGIQIAQLKSDLIYSQSESMKLLAKADKIARDRDDLAKLVTELSEENSRLINKIAYLEVQEAQKPATRQEPIEEVISKFLKDKLGIRVNIEKDRVYVGIRLDGEEIDNDYDYIPSRS